MPSTKEIRIRLASVKNTKKITYAMKLVAAAKLRRAQESVTKSRDYTQALLELLASVQQESAGLDFRHPLMEERESVKTIRLLVVGGNRGLCGGYNTNLNKKIDAVIREKSAPGVSIETVLLGRKPAEYFRRLTRPYMKSFEELPEDGNKWPIDDFSLSLESDFMEKKADEVYIIYTKFKSALSQTLMCERILPMAADASFAPPAPKHGEAHHLAPSGVTLFEPSVKEVFEALMPRILRARIRQACLDAKASEYGSRMTAMDAATKNAGELIQKLQLAYNKLRQSGITSELLDIIGGSEAIK